MSIPVKGRVNINPERLNSVGERYGVTIVGSLREAVDVSLGMGVRCTKNHHGDFVKVNGDIVCCTPIGDGSGILVDEFDISGNVLRGSMQVNLGIVGIDDVG